MARVSLRPLLQSNSFVFLFLCTFLWPCQIPELNWERMERQSCAGRASLEWDKVPRHSCLPGKAQVGHSCVIKYSLHFSLQCSIGFHTLTFFGFFLVLLCFPGFFVAVFLWSTKHFHSMVTTFHFSWEHNCRGSSFLLAPTCLRRPSKTFWLFFSCYHLPVLG